MEKKNISIVSFPFDFIYIILYVKIVFYVIQTKIVLFITNLLLIDYN